MIIPISNLVSTNFATRKQNIGKLGGAFSKINCHISDIRFQSYHCHLKTAKSIRLLIISWNFNFNVTVFMHDLFLVKNWNKVGCTVLAWDIHSVFHRKSLPVALVFRVKLRAERSIVQGRATRNLAGTPKPRQACGLMHCNSLKRNPTWNPHKRGRAQNPDMGVDAHRLSSHVSFEPTCNNHNKDQNVR